MAAKSKIPKPPVDLSWVQEIDTVLLSPEQTKMTILELINQYRDDVNLTKMPMVFKIPEGCTPTDEDKLAKLWTEKVNPNKNTVYMVKQGIYHQNAEPVYKNPLYVKKWISVNQFLPGKCKINVKTDEEIELAEKNLWDNVDKKSRYLTVNEIGRYVFDLEKSVSKYDKNSLSLLPFENLMPKVLHHFTEPVPGCTTSMMYLGKKGSTFIFHVEDKEGWSANYVHVGNPKLWYFLEPIAARPLEEKLKQLLEGFTTYQCGPDCPTICRHKILFIHPSVLRDLGYTVRKIIQREGYLVIVPPRVYHWGANLGENIAEAINFFVDEKSLIFGLLSLTCPKKEEDNPTFNMEWFVWECFPEHYKKYINGEWYLDDPVDNTRKKILVPPPNVKYTLKKGNHTLEFGGIKVILAAKTQDQKQLVYIDSGAGYSWLERSYAETLFWVSKHNDKRLDFHGDIIFSMEPWVIRHFEQIDLLLKYHEFERLEQLLDPAQNFAPIYFQPLPIDADDESFMEMDNGNSMEVDDGIVLEQEQKTSNRLQRLRKSSHVALVDLTEDSELYELSAASSQPVDLPFVPVEVKIEPPDYDPKIKNCRNCGVHFSKYKTSQTWTNHRNQCSSVNIYECDECEKEFSSKDSLKRHLKYVHFQY